MPPPFFALWSVCERKKKNGSEFLCFDHLGFKKRGRQKTCHVTRAGHWCVRDPRSMRTPVFPSSSSPSLTSSPSSSSPRRRRRHETFSFLFRFFSASSLGARDRKSFEIRMRSKCLSNDARYAHRTLALSLSKGGGREKKRRAGVVVAHKQTHRLETSLFGAVKRTDWAAAVWVKENILVTCVRVLNCVD